MERGGNYEQYNQQYQQHYLNQDMSIGNQQYQQSYQKQSINGNSEHYGKVDLIALIVGIISIATCSGCLIIALIGIILATVVLFDASGKYKNKVKAVIALILNIFSIVVFTLIIFIPTNKLPYVEGKELGYVQETLTSMNNDYIILHEYEFSDTVEKGYVTRLEPQSGEKVDDGAEIIIFISRGKAVIIPETYGMTVETATNELYNIGLSIDIKEQYSDSVDAGYIINSIPASNTNVESGTLVTLVTSIGPEIKMPNIIGVDIEEGKMLLEQLGIVKIAVSEEYSEMPIGTIINTSINEGETVYDSDEVKIVISKGTLEQEIQLFKDNCQSVSYDDLMRYPTTYQTTPIKLTVTITELEAETFLGLQYGTSIWATYKGETVILTDNREIQEPALRVGDKITIFGYGNGTSTIDVKQKEYQGGLLLGFSYDKTVDSYEVPNIKFDYVEF